MPAQRAASAVFAVLVMGVDPTWAQAPAPGAGNIGAPRILAAPLIREHAIGTLVKSARPAQPSPAAASADRESLGLSCRMVCSPLTPRHVIGQVSFPDAVARSAGLAAGVTEVRLDIAGTPSGFREGNFGTVRLDDVATTEVRPGAGLDVERLRQLVQPTFLHKVEANRIAPRDPALSPQRLRQVFGAAAPPAGLSADLQQALQRDARTGALEQMRLIAQGVEIVRDQPRRTVIVEGLQPGLTYGVRVVHERDAQAETAVENICRVPVCPADFQQPR